MAKKIVGYIKLQVPAGKANPSPPIGPALGQRGLNIMEFCKAFNAADPEAGAGHADSGGDHRLPTELHLRDQDAADLLLPDEGGGHREGLADARQGHRRQGDDGAVREIAEQKMVDLNANDLEAACSMIAGSARSMGLEVVE